MAEICTGAWNTGINIHFTLALSECKVVHLMCIQCTNIQTERYYFVISNARFKYLVNWYITK